MTVDGNSVDQVSLDHGPLGAAQRPLARGEPAVTTAVYRQSGWPTVLVFLAAVSCPKSRSLVLVPALDEHRDHGVTMLRLGVADEGDAMHLTTALEVFSPSGGSNRHEHVGWYEYRPDDTTVRLFAAPHAFSSGPLRDAGLPIVAQLTAEQASILARAARLTCGQLLFEELGIIASYSRGAAPSDDLEFAI